MGKPDKPRPTPLRDPADWQVPIRPASLVADTGHLSLEEFGLYVRLLCASFLHDGIPAAAEHIAPLARADPETVRRLWKAAAEPYFGPHPKRQDRLVHPGWYLLRQRAERKWLKQQLPDPDKGRRKTAALEERQLRAFQAKTRRIQPLAELLMGRRRFEARTRTKLPERIYDAARAYAMERRRNREHTWLADEWAQRLTEGMVRPPALLAALQRAAAHGWANIYPERETEGTEAGRQRLQAAADALAPPIP